MQTLVNSGADSRVAQREAEPERRPQLEVPRRAHPALRGEGVRLGRQRHQVGDVVARARHVGLELDRGLVVSDVLALRVLIGVRAQRRPALAQRLLIAAEVGLATGGSGRRARGRGGPDGQRVRRHRQEGQQREHGRTKSLHRSVPSVRSAKPPQREQPQPAGRDVPRHLGPGRVSRPDVRAASRGPSVAEIWSLAPPPFPHPPAPPGPSGAGSLAPPACPSKLPSWIGSLTQPQGLANPLRRLQGASFGGMLRLGETHDMSSTIATTEARPRWSRGRAVAVAGTVGPVALITVAGAVLRLWSFDRVGANPFYDAAVRSMSLSWHNFFFGAFEPGAQVSVDKAPADLWLQVASIKLFGFTDVAMRVPEVAGGILAIPLLYDLVRRLFGHVAGIAAAATLAVLPAAILTAHSDTMDSVMMALDVLAAWLVVVGAQRRSAWPVVAAGAVVGLAFNVKLFEALIFLPALALLAILAGEGSLRRRSVALGGSLAALLTVGLGWIAVASLTPLGQRPWPIGSSDGSIWNVVFAYDGVNRVTARASTAALAIDPPGVLRFFSQTGRGYLLTVGTTLVAALVIGGAALAVAVLERRPRPGRRSLPLAGAAFFGTWLVIGLGLLSHMQRMQPRYLDAVVPAIAAVVGIYATAIASTSRS